MAKNTANIMLPGSQISVCTIGVFINTNHVQKCGGGGGGGAGGRIGGGGGGGGGRGRPIGWPAHLKKWEGNCPVPTPMMLSNESTSAGRTSKY